MQSELKPTVPEPKALCRKTWASTPYNQQLRFFNPLTLLCCFCCKHNTPAVELPPTAHHHVCSSRYLGRDGRGQDSYSNGPQGTAMRGVIRIGPSGSLLRKLCCFFAASHNSGNRAKLAVLHFRKVPWPARCNATVGCRCCSVLAGSCQLEGPLHCSYGGSRQGGAR